MAFIEIIVEEFFNLIKCHAYILNNEEEDSSLT
jgi:hypothetical protein